MSARNVPPGEVLDLVEVEGAALRRVGRTNVWLCTGGDPFVLRAHPTPTVSGSGDVAGYRLSGLAALAVTGVPEVEDGAAEAIAAAVAWVHDVLGRLAASVPVPMPLPLLRGATFRRVDEVVWETLSFLPGSVVGEQRHPLLDEVGALLARYHRASATLSVGDRPARTPIADLASVVDWSRAEATMQRADGRDLLRSLMDRLEADLDAVGHEALPSGVLHGDPTAHNVLTDGDPPNPYALIDFDLAYHDPFAADIAFALWRSGRPSPTEPRIDPRRMRAFIAGYSRERPLTSLERRAVPIYLRARGLQMLAKRTRLGIADNGPLEQVLWTREHHDELTLIAGSA